MQILISGTYSKKDFKWTVELPSLAVSVTAESPFRAFADLQEHLRKETGEPNLECTFHIKDSGTFLMITAKSQAFVQFIAQQIKNQNLDEKEIDELLTRIVFRSKLD